MGFESTDIYRKAKETADYLRERVSADFQTPKIAIICGSGLGGLANTIHAARKAVYAYASIPHFPRPTGQPG